VTPNFVQSCVQLLPHILSLFLYVVVVTEIMSNQSTYTEVCTYVFSCIYDAAKQEAEYKRTPLYLMHMFQQHILKSVSNKFEEYIDIQTIGGLEVCDIVRLCTSVARVIYKKPYVFYDNVCQDIRKCNMELFKDTVMEFTMDLNLETYVEAEHNVSDEAHEADEACDEGDEGEEDNENKDDKEDNYDCFMDTSGGDSMSEDCFIDDIDDIDLMSIDRNIGDLESGSKSLLLHGMFNCGFEE
jgi:hypothetical protein